MTKVDNFRANLATLISKPHGRKSEVAHAAGITPQYLSRLLSGEHDPGFALAIRLCEVTGYSLDSMLRRPSVFRRELAESHAATSTKRSLREHSVTK